jgi:hypothetical protein
LTVPPFAAQGEVLLPASPGDPDRLRAWQPWVYREVFRTVRWPDRRNRYRIETQLALRRTPADLDEVT